MSGRPATLRRIWSALPWQGWLLLAVFYALAVVTTAHSFNEWISDSRFYLAWSYRYLGYSEAEAAQLTRDYLQGRHGLETCDWCWPADFQRSFFHGEDGAVVGPRLVYPLLSAPFVALLGPPGMLVVPLLSYAAGTAVLAVLAARLWSPWWGVAAGGLLLVPFVAVRYASAAMTDAPALLFTALGLLFLPLRRPARRLDPLWFSLILVLALFTRQFAVTVMAGVGLAWALVAVRQRRVRNPWLPFAVASVAVTGAVLVTQSRVTARFLDGDELDLVSRYQNSARERFGVDGPESVPAVLWNLLRVDFFWVLRLEIFLIVFVAVALVAALWRLRSELSAMLVGVAAATLALTVLIVDPTYFRYFVPVVPLMALCVVALAADLTATPARDPARSTEAVPAAPDQPDQPVRPYRLAVPAGLGLAAAVVVLAFVLVVQRPGDPTWLGVVGYAGAVVGLGLVAARLAGPSAGVLAALALALSQTVVGRLLDEPATALAVLAVLGCLAALPRAGGVAGGPARQAAFAVALAVALLADYRALAVAAGVAAAWLTGLLVDRRDARPWAPYGLVALAATAVTLVVDLVVRPRSTYYSVAWLARGDVLSDLPGRARGVLTGQLWQLGADRVVLAVCVVAGVALLARWRDPWARLAGASVLAGLAMLVVGGSPDRFATLTLAYPAMLVAAVGLVTAGGRSAAERIADRSPTGADGDERAGSPADRAGLATGAR